MASERVRRRAVNDVAAAVADLEFSDAEPALDADIVAARELRARLMGDGAPLVLSAGLLPRLAQLDPETPEELWTLFEPDTVAQLHALEAASGADVTVAATRARVAGSLVGDEPLDLAELYAKGLWLAERSSAPFSALAVDLAGCTVEQAAAAGRVAARGACGAQLVLFDRVGALDVARAAVGGFAGDASSACAVVLDAAAWRAGAGPVARALRETGACAVGRRVGLDAPDLERACDAATVVRDAGLGFVALLADGAGVAEAATALTCAGATCVGVAESSSSLATLALATALESGV